MTVPAPTAPPPPVGPPREGRAPRARRTWAPGDVVLLGLAIVLALAVAAVFTASALVSISTAREAGARIGTDVELTDLREGDCVADFPQYAPPDFTLVDCGTPHAAEFVFLVESSEAIDEGMGDRALAALADTYCDTTFRYRIHLSDGVDDLPDADVAGYVGSRASFAGGAEFHCFLYNTTGEPLVGEYYEDDGF
jgi:hypothetical protein